MLSAPFFIKQSDRGGGWPDGPASSLQCFALPVRFYTLLY